MEATLLTAPSGRSYQPQAAKCTPQGSYGTIYKCKAHEGTAPLPGFVALKVVSWDVPGLDEETVLSERNALDSIAPHAGIVKLSDSWVDGDGHKLYMAFDWCERGDLLEYSKTHRIDEAGLWHLHRQVLGVLEHIHSQGYAHVDVKPENLLVVDVNPLKVALTDFGSARRICELGNGPIFTTRYYAAPEIRNRTGQIDESCDYFAWNMSLFYVLVAQYSPKSLGKKECFKSWPVDETPNWKLVSAPGNELLVDLLVKSYMSAFCGRKACMTSHGWVRRGPFVPTTSAEPATRPAAVWPAPASFQLFGPSRLPPLNVPIAGPSSPTSTAARKPLAKRASVEKCLEKEKIGKGSGVGSTADQRAASSRKKAVKRRAEVKELDGPAQAVLRLRAVRPRVNYKY